MVGYAGRFNMTYLIKDVVEAYQQGINKKFYKILSATAACSYISKHQDPKSVPCYATNGGFQAENGYTLKHFYGLTKKSVLYPLCYTFGTYDYSKGTYQISSIAPIKDSMALTNSGVYGFVACVSKSQYDADLHHKNPILLEDLLKPSVILIPRDYIKTTAPLFSE